MNKLVYILDDDQVYLKFMQNHFSMMGGFDVVTFSNGKAALQNLQTSAPFMMILDHNLNDPSGDGIFYLRQIKKMKSSLPVFLITSEDTEELRNEAKKAGARKLIVKSDSFLVQLRTAIDEISSSSGKGLFAKLFK